jgi:flagellar biosynthesis/type III secretory pathway protein FliH
MTMNWSTDMRTPKAHLFAEDFDAPPRLSEPDSPVMVEQFTADDLTASREIAWQEGFAAGQREVRNNQDVDARQLLQDIAGAIDEARAEFMASGDRIAEELARLLLTSLRHVLPALCAQYGETEIAAIMRAIRPSLLHDPALRIQVAEGRVEPLRHLLAEAHHDIADQVQVAASPRLGPSDITLRWHMGESVRDAAALWGDIQSILGLHGLNNPEPAPTDHKAREPAHAE